MTHPPEDVLAVLANPERLRMLLLLRTFEELCVCDFTEVIDIAQPNMSRHLAQMKAAGIVSGERRGRWVYYRMHAGLPEWVVLLIDGIDAAHRDVEPYRGDRLALQSLPDRAGAARCR